MESKGKGRVKAGEARRMMMENIVVRRILEGWVDWWEFGGGLSWLVEDGDVLERREWIGRER